MYIKFSSIRLSFWAFNRYIIESKPKQVLQTHFNTF